MKPRISATRSARNFSELLNRVYYRGEEFVIERGGKPVARLAPAEGTGLKGAELARLWRAIPKPDRAFWDDVEEAARRQPRTPKSPWRR